MCDSCRDRLTRSSSLVGCRHDRRTRRRTAELISITADLERAYPRKRRARCERRAARRRRLRPVRPALFILLARCRARSPRRMRERHQSCSLRGRLPALRRPRCAARLGRHHATRPAGAGRDMLLTRRRGCRGNWTRRRRCSRARRYGARRCSAAFAGGTSTSRSSHHPRARRVHRVAFGLSADAPGSPDQSCSRRSPTAGEPGDLPACRTVAIRSALVIVELALAVVLVSGAALLIRSFWSLQQVNPGFQAEGVLKAEYQLPASRYPVDFRRWPDFKEQHVFNAAAARARDGAARRSCGGPRGESSTRSGFHQLLHDRRPRSGGAVVARNLDPAGEPVLLRDRRTRARFREGCSLDSDTTTATRLRSINAAAVTSLLSRIANPLAHGFDSGARLEQSSASSATRSSTGSTEASPIAVYTPLAQTPSANGAGVLLLTHDRRPSSL